MKKFGIIGLILLFCLRSWAPESLNVPTGINPYNSLDITNNFNANVVSTTFNWNKNNSRDQALVLKVKSSNGGLRHATITTSKINYTFAYTGGSNVTMSTTDQNVRTRTILQGAAAGSETANSSIAYTGVAASLLYQGTYSDTITFTYTVTPTGQATNTYTRTFTLTATAIGSTLDFSITPQPVASNLTLTSTVTDLHVATVSETSNSATGYLVKVKSTNGGFMKNAASGASPPASEKINYTAKYGATSMTLTPANTDWTIKTVAAGIYNSISSNITISYTGPSASSMRSGNYSDTMTFTIQAQ